METIKGTLALQRAETLSKMGGTFSIAFFPYSRTKAIPDRIKMKTYSGCRMRTTLPKDKFDIDGKHYLLFLNDKDEPRSCYRSLIRAIGFSDEDNKLYRVIWYE